jgi:hypothetical protein
MVTISDFSKRLNSDGKQGTFALLSELLRTAELRGELSATGLCRVRFSGLHTKHLSGKKPDETGPTQAQPEPNCGSINFLLVLVER